MLYRFRDYRRHTGPAEDAEKWVFGADRKAIPRCIVADLVPRHRATSEGVVAVTVAPRRPVLTALDNAPNDP